MFAIAAALALSASTPSWIVRTQTNLLRQPETVAEMLDAAAGPNTYLRFSCSVMTGPVFETGLGARSFEEFARFSADDAAKEAKVSLTIQYSSALLAVTATPVAGNVTAHAYVVTGSDAIAAVRTLETMKTISIAVPDKRAEFDVSGAAPAIGQVLDACPFKG
jgi:hypothetical protein